MRALIEAAERLPKCGHLARFIRVAVYTGTRKDAVLRLRFMPHVGGGHVDTQRGLMYRREIGSAETSKRQPTVPIPVPLLEHLREWENSGAQWVVQRGGCRVGDIKTSWKHVVAEAGVDHCVPHDLRRTAITWAMQRGVPIFQASGFFGVSVDLLERVYAQHHPDFMREAVDAMSVNLYDRTDSGALRRFQSA